jgi:glycosyltransferase involved in cell wall biosynthesis
MKQRVCVLRQAVFPETCPPTAREVDALKEAGYEVHVIAQRRHFDTELPAYEEQDGVFIYRLAGGRRKGSRIRYLFEYGFFLIQAFFLLSFLHLRFRFSLIQVNTMPDFLVFVTWFAKLFGAKILLMMKEPMPELWETIYGEKAPFWLIGIEQAAIAYADRVFTVTENLKAAYVQRGANPEKIQVLLNVPEPEHWLKPSPVIKHENFTLLCHGTIEDRYGHDVILDALAIARQEVPELHLRITGHGSKVGELPAMIRQRGLQESVDFLSWVSHEDLIAEIRAADVGIIGLKSSPYSNLIHTNKMYEYILFQKPVILSRLEAVSANFGDNCLTYYEAENAEDLAEKILYLYHHQDAAAKLALAAHECFQSAYSWDIEKFRYLQTYSELATS